MNVLVYVDIAKNVSATFAWNLGPDRMPVMENSSKLFLTIFQ